MDKMKLQNDEFDAADGFAKQLVRLFKTPVVDDDYPEVRHGYESALRALIAALKANGRIPDVAAPQPVLPSFHDIHKRGCHSPNPKYTVATAPQPVEAEGRGPFGWFLVDADGAGVLLKRPDSQTLSYFQTTEGYSAVPLYTTPPPEQLPAEAKPAFNRVGFGLACTVGWTELAIAMRKDGHAVNDSSGPNTRKWMEETVRAMFAPEQPAIDLEDDGG